ncbi:MAG TPA: UDP-N-acetylglucosamine--N-acetylmuramyl-(pentapeptide) pyrophosphoryl-undecaprenol N-acetylglucosamine transferase [Opitutaceae bacterium]|nr:UDP-N-acetylglucosamine--N-acetylmuramyl-(pentapeptide) pyrophosphoryl-undecaprenol N-acetylglucosamine transferase [Opitutaceae bacterium]
MSRFLISCGGTGGHLSPGIALAEGLVARGHAVTLLISHKKVDARLIEKYPDLRFVRLPGAGFGWNPVALARFVVTQTHGFFFSLRQVRALRPDGIVGFGGFTSASIVVAGALRGVPVVLHEANRVPGRAIRLLGRLAKRVYLPPGINLSGVRAGIVRPMGLPVRREIARRPAAEARTELGLYPQGRVLAILGGSQGAAALNDWARRELSALAAEGIQLFCVTGLNKDISETLELPARNGAPVRAIFAPFCDRMAALLSAADLVVSRAGAGTLAELGRCGTPAILVPFPHAADDHQRANAAYFAQQGGGVVIEQNFLATLRAEVRDVIFNDGLLAKFRANLQRLESANLLETMLDDLETVVARPGAQTPASKPPQPAPASV